MKKGKVIVYVGDDETAFLNVDVVVSAAASLEPLVVALGEKVSVHYVGRLRRGVFQARFALYSPKNADTAISKLTKLIESLPRAARCNWNNAHERVFDVGFQGGLKPHCREFDISEQALAAVARVDGSIKVTLYVAPGVESLRQARRRTTRCG